MTEQPKNVRRRIRSAVVTGATGMLGATLTRVLLREGVEVTAVIRPGSRKKQNLPESDHLTVLEKDLSELRDLLLPVRPDAFFHFAWEGTYGESRNSEELQERNARLALESLKTAKRLGAKVFVGAGSQAEYGASERRKTPGTRCHPETAYGKAKLSVCRKGRALAKRIGIDFIWTRVFSVYGPYDNDYTLIPSAIRSLLADGHFAATAGEQIWNYLYAGDAAEWFFRLAKHGRSGEVYLLAGKEEKTLREYLTELKDTVSPDGTVGFGEIPYRPGQVMVLSADIGKTVQDTKYAPKTAFRNGIEKTLEWIRKTPEKC